MSSVVRAPATPAPITVLMEAVIWAQIQGYRIKPGTVGYGVQCSSSHDVRPWVRDPRADGLDPLGAAILQHQPQASLPAEAAALAVGGSIAWIPWVEGMADGLSAERRSAIWARSVQHVADRYHNGYEAGLLLRIAIRSRTCPRHGVYALDATFCPVCRPPVVDLDEKLGSETTPGEA